MISSILEVADQFDAIVFDQFGVLHDGVAPYPAAQATLAALSGRKMGVLSNSGKRAAPNADRIAGKGFDTDAFQTIMTSGEALWQGFATGQVPGTRLYPIQSDRGDAARWAQGLDVTLTEEMSEADAILCMGITDGSSLAEYEDTLQASATRGLPLYCSNPDLKSPRGTSEYVMSPGALAMRYADLGGPVHLYGKPHKPIFDAMQAALDVAPEKILMVGDSLHHDILGAQQAGWASLLIMCGVHRPDIGTNAEADIAALAAADDIAPPTFALTDLR